jgi:hypothetical protein
LIGEHTAANLSDKQGHEPTAGIQIRKLIAGSKAGDNVGSEVMVVMVWW